jgi:nitroreductase
MSTMACERNQRGASTVLTEATLAARFAPSIHNTQPWHWRVRHGALELWADHSRQLRTADPDGRMLTVSCGVSLHHARVALAAQGYRVTVLPFPDPTHPDYLAHLTTWDEIPVTPAVTRQYQAIALRRTDRRPVADTRVDDIALTAITTAVQAEGCYLHPLCREEVIELAAQAAYAQGIERADDARRGELALWAGGTRADGAGIPDANIPTHRPQTTVPERDFGHRGTLPIGAGHGTGATYAILYGDLDDRPEWLEAGQALSAAWLTATETEVSVMPLSGMVEIPSIRQALRAKLSGVGYPYLVLRLGTADRLRAPLPTPRLPASQTVSYEDG